MNEVKSRVHGAANLIMAMHQHQLLGFGSRIGLIPSREIAPSLTIFRAADYDSAYSFLPPQKSRRKLTDLEFKHLQQHYKTEYEIPSINDSPDLVHMDHYIDVWHRCCVDNVVYHCDSYQRKNSTRLNHLACIEEQIDANARFSHRSRPERMVSQLSYVYIQFYAVHVFRGSSKMLMYSEYRKTNIHDGLVEDKGRHLFGFQDIQILDHLCARVKGAEGKVYFVDERETMEKRLRAALAR